MSNKNTKVMIVLFAIALVVAILIYVFFLVNPNFATPAVTSGQSTTPSNILNTQEIGTNLTVVYAALTIAIPIMIAIMTFLLFMAMVILQNISVKLTYLISLKDEGSNDKIIQNDEKHNEPGSLDHSS
jgi:uncharacterized membrane protein